jgi:hypothetical protein
MAPQTARPAVACGGHAPSHHLHVAEPRQGSRREGQQTKEAESTSNVGALATDRVSENTKLRPFGWGFVFDYRRRSLGGSGEPRQEPTVTSAPRAAPHLRDEANTSKWRRTCASRRAASPCRASIGGDWCPILYPAEARREVAPEFVADSKESDNRTSPFTATTSG